MGTTALDLVSSGKLSTWGSFVAVPENRLALAAARRLAQALPKLASFPHPLFLHGPSGTGKTLLVQTLLHQCILAQPELTAQLLAAADLGLPSPEGSPEFLDLLADPDLLILESLQHLPNRATNLLIRLLDRRRATRKYTVVTANLGPAQLKHLPSRLTSRLGAGLVVQLAPLPFPSRRILAEELTARRKIFLTGDALDMLALDPTGGGVRPLLGAIERLTQLATEETILDAADVTRLLSDHPARAESICDVVMKKVAKTFNLSVKDLLGPRRHKAILKPRQLAMYLARKVGKLSFPQIGQAFGGRDHTTVLHACEAIEKTLKHDPSLKKTVRDLIAQLS